CGEEREGVDGLGLPVFGNSLQGFASKLSDGSLRGGGFKTLSEESPQGPFSAVLVITDEEAETDDTFCFGMCKSTKIEMLPFPQDKILSVVHTDSSGNRDTSVTKISCKSRNPKPLDPRNIYQTVKINRRHDHIFFAKSVAPDGTPPLFLKKKGWELPTSRSLHPRV
ncbi:unnamed protein product, partial [Brassica oleracea]